ncbi:RadC family protein [Dinghuibacter silviterrae]|uniref:DNA repair protein RadC n=1 Tax=Dinghuibacter silviterrae TaxID=1539049 RepID=A0A4V3GLR8_9BACT|nr:DNA repair protein RadC [Dinghuibacter silviterrae]TDX00593.1 DNA repair protein RadC [Dinghuibacter silviterrae]
MGYLRLKDWPEGDRPREKLVRFGPAFLSDTELLAILIRTGWQGRSALDLARELMELNNLSLHELGKMRLDGFRKIFGERKVYGIVIQAALELGRRRESVGLPLRTKITSSRSVVDYLRPLLKDRFQEEFVGIYLNQAGEVIREEWLSKGGISSTVADIRLIMRVALESGASSFVLCHNHPSGALQPSPADLDFTRRITSASALLDLRLLDHVIVSERGAYSFADHGQLG